MIPCEGEKAKEVEHQGRCERATEHGCELARCLLSFDTSSGYHLATKLAQRSHNSVNCGSYLMLGFIEQIPPVHSSKRLFIPAVFNHDIGAVFKVIGHFSNRFEVVDH